MLNELFNRKVGLTNEEIKRAIDPIDNVKHRNILGGPSFEEVKRMITDRTERIVKVQNGWEIRKKFQQDKIAGLKGLAKKSRGDA
ncbi:MAG: hypothetical protein V1793_10930 [Pseudomonadota bacterium]